MTTRELGIHYIFNDDGHYMDAFIFNKCEHQLLELIHEISKLVSVEIEVNVTPLSEGSLWGKFTITTKQGTQIKVDWITALLVAVTINPLGTALTNAVNYASEYVMDGAYIYNLKKEKERLELEKEIRELREDSIKHATVEKQNKIKRKVSNFYSEAKKERRITSIGFCSSVAKPNSNELVVNRNSFDNYILKDSMEDENIIPNAKIDIIAPVLRKRKIKWQGLLGSQQISFKLSDSDFKKSVLNGTVDFTGGTYIIGKLTVYTAVDSEGETRISGYEVKEVHSYGKDDSSLTVTTGEKKRQEKRAAESLQNCIDFENGYNDDAFNV